MTEKYRYDGFDRIAELRAGAGTDAKTTRYVYDPFDRTVSQTTAAGTASEKTTGFTYLGTSGDVLSEEVAGKVTKSYEYSAWGQKLTQIKHNDDGSSEISQYTYHPKGDVEAITKQEDGTTRATYGYTAYGENDDSKFTGVDKPDAQKPDAEPYNTYRFNGHRWDQPSGTYDMGFRHYDPGLNQFLTRDMYNGALDDLTLAVDPFSGSRYAFAGGNPISNVELDGHGFFSSLGGAVKNFASGVVDHIKEDPLQFVGEVAAGVAVAVAVGAVCATGVGCAILIGAAAGAASAAYGYGYDVAQGEHSWDTGDFVKTTLTGAAIGGVTGGLTYGAGAVGRAALSRLGRANPEIGAEAGAASRGGAAPRGGSPEPAPAGAKPASAPAKPAAAPAKPPAGPASPVEAAGGVRPPTRIFSARVLNRSAEEPGPYHNFPGTFDDLIFNNGERTVTEGFWKKARPGLSHDSVQYRLPGTVNGKEGVFEIFTRPSVSGRTEVIMHRFFRRGRS